MLRKKDKFLIMLIGKTHCGKTTFAQEVKKKKKDLLVLEADPIAVFMKEKYPELRFSDDKEHTGNFEEISLKYRTFLLFLEFAMSLNKSIMLSNSNMWTKGRKMVFDLSRKFGYRIIGIYFDFPEKLLIERIKKSKRSLNVLRTSKDFNELVLNQRERMQAPKFSDFFKFYHIKNEKEVMDLKKEIIKILN